MRYFFIALLIGEPLAIVLAASLRQLMQSILAVLQLPMMLILIGLVSCG
jgi:hypothetical protein